MQRTAMCKPLRKCVGARSSPHLCHVQHEILPLVERNRVLHQQRIGPLLALFGTLLLRAALERRHVPSGHAQRRRSLSRLRLAERLARGAMQD
eukprot:6204819-Pleurochrysis_carterae.AAC.2